jgi:hypothetical protein
MKMNQRMLCLALPCFLLPNLALAWGGAGHQVIAAEAYRGLSPELKREAFAVLSAHPDFAKWTNSYHPNANFDLAAYVFMRSSTWPDEIRRSGSRFDHPNWHFIDYPLRPPAFAFEPDARPTDNVLFGIAESEKVLSDTNAKPEMRAVSMSWLIHLIGDEHQPLHCESLFNDAYPNGDKGGNDFYVKPAQRGIRLHGVWDGLLGSSVNPRTQWNYAIELDAKFPRAALPELATHTAPKEWSLESRQLAVEDGYLNGRLKGGTSADTAPELPAGYTKQAKAVAERQGALSGYRLADEIEKSLKFGGVASPLPVNATAPIKTELPARIGTAEAGRYYNESMVVTGKVVQVSSRPTITFINLDRTGPNSPLAVVIFPENLGKFGDLQRFNGKSVEISGTITEYRNKPEIVLESPDQIKLVE